MTNPDVSIYTPAFFEAWETFAKELTVPLNDLDPQPAARPLAAEQTRHIRASMAVASLLKSVGQDESAAKFHRIAQALQDLVDGIPHPLFRIERPTGKAGRRPDNSAIWGARSQVCVGLEFLIASGLEQHDAIKVATGKHRQKLAKLQRPGTDLKSSLATWLKSFAADEVANEVALEDYKLGLSQLKTAQLIHPGNRIRQAGEALIATAAAAASTLP